MNMSRLRTIALVTLTMLFALQLFRVFMAGVIAYLGQYVGAVQEGIFALVVFGLATLAPFVRKWLSERGALALTIGGIALVRLLAQFMDAPVGQLACATSGLILLGWFLPIWLQSPRNRPSADALPIFAIALPLALAIDTTTRALLLTYDFVWRRDIGSIGIIVALVVITLIALGLELRETAEEKVDEPSLSQALPLIALGAFLYLALAVIHNPAIFSVLAGQDEFANEFTIAVSVMSAWASIVAMGWMIQRRWLGALVVGIVLVLSLTLVLVRAPLGPVWLALASFSAWISIGWLLTSTTRVTPQQTGLWRTALAVFLMFVVMLVSVFVVGQYKLDAINVACGTILLIATAWATRKEIPSPNIEMQKQMRMLIAIVGISACFVFLLVSQAQPSAPTTPPSNPQTLRVMTYNIHQGISADFAVDLDGIAETLASQNPDVVVLNEVNRARPNYGLIDTLPFIAERLQMHYVFGTAYNDGQYGNAILSRYPILASNNTHYRDASTETRGVLRALIDSPIGKVTVYGTHLDNVNGAKSVRAPQVAEFLQIWNKTPRAILMGDLNAEPNKPELQPIYRAGWVDALRVDGKDDAFTYWDAQPTPGRRIDYIFVTPDLKVNNVQVIERRTSDHLPIVAEIRP